MLYGIQARSNTTTDNSGDITTSGENANGIYLDGSSTTATHSGTITTGGDYAAGIRIENNNTISVDAIGEIVTSGIGAYGVNFAGTGNVLSHAGKISTDGESAYGIYAKPGTNTAYNDITVEAGGQIITAGSHRPTASISATRS